MEIIHDKLPPLLPNNTYVAMDSEWFRMEKGRMHRPLTGHFGCLTLCYQVGEVYFIQDKALVPKVLEQVNNCVWVIHNAKFDVCHLRRLATIPPRSRLIDTMMMDRILWNGYYDLFSEADLARRYLKIHLDKSLQDKWKDTDVMTDDLIQYAANDPSVLLQVWHEQKKYITKNDMKIYQEIDLATMWAVLDFRGFRLDVEGWKSLAEDNKFHAQKLEELLDFNPRSPQQIVAKLSERGFKRLPDSSAETLEKFIGKYPDTDAAKQAEIVLECKEFSTFASRYGKSWIENYLEDFVDGTQGFVSDYFITGAETGRMSARNPPLHQVPSRGTKIFREKFIARPGCKLIVADYSQQEVVILAYVTGDGRLIEVCNSGKDIYIMMAKMMYEKDIEKSDPIRARMKAVVLGIDYGMTEYGLARKEGISKKEAAEVIFKFRDTFTVVADYLDRMEHEKTLVYTVAGRKYHLNPVSGQCYRNALNSPIQGTAADMIKKAVVAIRKGWKWACEFGIVNVVHDEIVLDVPEEFAEEIKDFVQETMVRVANEMCPGLTFKVDAKICMNWGEK